MVVAPDGLTYTYDSSTKTLTVTLTSGYTETELTSLYHGNVVNDSSTILVASGMEYVSIADGITLIGANAFYNCTSLKSVSIPDSVTAIYGDAFDSCTAMTSAVIGTGLTELRACAFMGCTSLTSVTFNSVNAPTIGASAFDLDVAHTSPVTCTVYTAGWGDDTVFTSTVKGSSTTILYGSIFPEHTVSIAFSAGGGSFSDSHGPGIQDGSSSIGTAMFFNGMWYWFYNMTVSEKTVTVSLNDMVDNMVSRPAGMSSLTYMEIQAPYQIIYDYQSRSSTYNVKFKRVNQDSICNYTVYPRWIPGRGDMHRCIITAPALGSLDFGQIQSITETYSASLNTIPIVCYGYSGAFCMDLGVTKKLEVNYLRVNPMVVDEDSADSRQWSNAHWIKVFKEFTDRWQMRTNGCLLYLKRPDNDRLGPEIVADDPVYEYYPDIDGENAYISSAPVKYDTASSQRIQNSVSFTIGTIYPRAPPEDMVAVTYKWSASVTINPDVVIYYPKGVYVQLPERFSNWNNIPTTNPTSLTVWTGWKDPATGSSAILQPKTLIKFDTATNIIANTVTIADSAIRILDPYTAGTRDFSYTLRRIDNDKTAYIYVNAIGGGGAGGKCSDIFYPQSAISGSNYGGSAGGGGGSSGVVLSGVYNILPPSVSVSVTVGAGGTVVDGGGNNGSNTIFSVDDQILGIAMGGKAGGAATLDGYTGRGGAGGSYAEQASVNAGGKGGDRVGIDHESSSYKAESGTDGNGDTGGAGGACTTRIESVAQQGIKYYVHAGAGGGGGPAEIIDTYTGNGGFQQKAGSGDDYVAPLRGGGGAGGYYYGNSGSKSDDKKDPQAGADGIAVLYLVNLEVVQ